MAARRMDEQAKRSALRLIPGGLYVVGVRNVDVNDASEDLNAFIASWVTQCSFKPPLVALGLKRGTRSHAMIRESGVFTLNFLAEDQKEIAKTFFRDLDVTPDTMNGIAYHRGETGAPIFPDLPAHVECEVVGFHEDGGDHDVVVGRVVAAGFQGEKVRPMTHETSGWYYGG